MCLGKGGGGDVITFLSTASLYDNVSNYLFSISIITIFFSLLVFKRYFTPRFNELDIKDPKRPYKCHLCPYAAHTRSNLKNHINAHTGERPYKCPVCGRGFTQKGNMQKHQQQHVEKYPFECNICGESCDNKISMQQHMVLHFNVE